MTIFLRLLALCLLATGPALAETAADRFAPKRGLNFELWIEWLSVEDTVTRPGFLDVFPDWRRYVPPDAVAALAPAGFDFVRLPIDPAPLLRLGPGPAQDALIDQVVETTTSLQATGLKVIVDLHSNPRWDEPWGTDTILTDAPLFDAYAALAGRLAGRLDGLPSDRTAFELMNEPTNDCGLGYDASLQAWPGQLRRLHDAARSAAPGLPLVMTGACWGGVDGLVVLDPTVFADDNLLWSFHSYAPFFFTHQGAPWTDGPQLFFADVPFPPSDITDDMAARLLADAVDRARAAGRDDMTQDRLAADLAAYRDTATDLAATDTGQVADWADAHGIPRNRIVMGEFGAIRDTGPGTRVASKSRAAFLAARTAAVEQSGFGWAVHSWTGSFGVADDATRRIDPEYCLALRLTGC